MRKVQVQCCFTSLETIRTIRDGEPRTATSTFTQLLSSDLQQDKPSSYDSPAPPPSSDRSWASEKTRCLTSTETIRLVRDGEKGVWRWGKREIIYLSLHCHHQNDSCIRMGSGGSHFNVSLIVRDKATRQCQQTTAFEEKEPKRIRTEVPSVYARPNRLTTPGLSVNGDLWCSYGWRKDVVNQCFLKERCRKFCLVEGCRKPVLGGRMS